MIEWVIYEVRWGHFDAPPPRANMSERMPVKFLIVCVIINALQ